MKKITLALTVFVLTVVTNSAFSQSSTEKYAKKKEAVERTRLFGDDDAAFKATTIPDKWKSESAVIINQKLDYAYMKHMGTPTVEETFRRRIKLLDKAAVKEYSEFQFIDYGTMELGLVGVKIIKPDGKVIEVNTDKAVDVEGEISSIFQSYNYYGVSKHKKLAIPDLEPGDIFDYFYYTKEIAGQFDRSFEPFSFTLNKKYPIMNQKFNFIVDHGFYINFNTYNGAPAVSQHEGTYKNGSADDKVMYYTVTDKEREKLKDEIWDYPLLNYPSVKFQLYFINGNERAYPQFLGEKDEVKKVVTMEEIVSKTNLRVKNNIPYVEAIVSDVKRIIKKNYAAEKDPEKLVDAMYHTFRHKVFFSEAEMENEKNLYRDVDQVQNYVKNLNTLIEKKDFSALENYFSNNINELAFITVMTQLFDDFKIDGQIVAAVPKSLGVIKNVLFFNEIGLAVTIKNGSKQKIYYPFTINSTTDFSDYRYEGCEGIAFNFSKSAKDVAFQPIKIPATASSFNSFSTKTEVNLDVTNQNLNLTRENKIGGDYKVDNSFAMYYNDDYMQEEITKYEKDFEYKELKNHAAKEKEMAKLKKQYFEKRNQWVKEKLKDDLSSDFEIVKYDTFNVVNRARFEPNSKFTYTEKFSVKNLANKIGPNFSMNVGALIGEQTKITEEETKRSSDVNYKFARVVENEIIVNIPDGFKADGLKDLNFNIDNAAGSFVSVAEQKGTTVSIKITKSYKHISEKKDAWPQLLEVLNASYDFSQKKIILKKG